MRPLNLNHLLIVSAFLDFQLFVILQPFTRTLEPSNPGILEPLRPLGSHLLIEDKLQVFNIAKFEDFPARL